MFVKNLYKNNNLRELIMREGEKDLFQSLFDACIFQTANVHLLHFCKFAFLFFFSLSHKTFLN